jgi:hypothetical protein
VALLKEFGSPSEIASRYRGEEYLIGPVLFPTFKMVVSIVLSVVVGIQVIIFAANALWGSTRNDAALHSANRWPGLSALPLARSSSSSSSLPCWSGCRQPRAGKRDVEPALAAAGQRSQPHRR